MSTFSNLSSLIPVEDVFSLVFYLSLGVYAVFTTILYYHWSEYSTDSIVSKITAVSYLASTLPLLGIMGLASLQL